MHTHSMCRHLGPEEDSPHLTWKSLWAYHRFLITITWATFEPTSNLILKIYILVQRSNACNHWYQYESWVLCCLPTPLEGCGQQKSELLWFFSSYADSKENSDNLTYRARRFSWVLTVIFTLATQPKRHFLYVLSHPSAREQPSNSPHNPSKWFPWPSLKAHHALCCHGLMWMIWRNEYKVPWKKI